MLSVAERGKVRVESESTQATEGTGLTTQPANTAHPCSLSPRPRLDGCRLRAHRSVASLRHETDGSISSTQREGTEERQAEVSQSRRVGQRERLSRYVA